MQYWEMQCDCIYRAIIEAKYQVLLIPKTCLLPNKFLLSHTALWLFEVAW